MSASLKPSKIDLDELQQQQIEADGDFSASKEKKQKGNQDSSYELPAHAAHRIHLKLSTKVNDPVKKEYVEESIKVELTPAEYERMTKNGSFAGYDSQAILHDPRPAAVQKASQTGDVPTGNPAEANKPLVSLQDAQMRYRELTKQDAPTDKSFEELVELIKPLEATLHAKSSTGGTTRTLRNKSDYVARYEELAAAAPDLTEALRKAPADATIEQLKVAIADLEAGAVK